jgi:hypothetical protein
MTITAPMPAQGSPAAPAESRPRVTRDQQLLAEVEGAFRAFMAFPHEHAFTVATLWVAHTHLQPWSRITPRLYYGSKQAGCGKTMAMELTTLMSLNGEVVIEPTGPGLISKIHNDHATVGLDEIDLFFGTRGTARSKERAVINGGYKRGATVDRERQDETEKRNIHGPMVLAGKNAHKFLTAESFETLRTRSIPIILERKPAGLKLAKYRSDIHEDRLRGIARRMARWGQHNGRHITSLDVEKLLPAGIDNRDAEIWTVLFQIAAFVGGDWLDRVIAAARALVLNQWGDDESPVLSPADELREAALGAFQPGEAFLPVSELVRRVRAVPGWWQREWTSPKGAAMSLAAELGTFRVEGTRAYVDTPEGRRQVRGYALADLLDVETEDPWDVEPSADDEWDDDELDALDDE